MPDQIDKGDLGGIRHAGKHGFAKKDPAEGNTVKPAHQTIALPAFDTVDIAQLMQTMIGLTHFITDPGAVLSATWRGALQNDLFKGGIKPDGKYFFTEFFPQAGADLEPLGK